MKVLFLDIDGVLNSSGSCIAKIGETISDRWAYVMQMGVKNVDPIAVALVNRLLTKSGAKLVLSTSHRTAQVEDTYFRSREHISRLNTYAQMLGITHPVFDATPSLSRPRGEEIAKWIQEYEWGSEDLESYVILDDGYDFHGTMPLVHCNADYGFTIKEYYKAAQILGVEESAIIY